MVEVVAASHQLGYVTIHTDDWIELDTKQPDRVAEFDDSARNCGRVETNFVALRLRARIASVFDGLRSSFFSKNHRLTSSVHSEIFLFTMQIVPRYTKEN